jgi:hypothetical protein
MVETPAYGADSKHLDLDSKILENLDLDSESAW